MQDLTLVGVHDDGEHLVLTSADGQRFRLPIDESLRAAVRRDRARLGQLQLAMDGRLTPREIQARIRAGQAAEEIATGSGLAVEQIRRFEGPVLAERQHVADQARRVVMRRSAPAAAHPPTLDEVVSERLEQREVDPASAQWDAWRLEDGRWTVSVAFAAAGRERRAHWTFSTQLRQLTPADDEARWLVDADPETTAEDASARRLAAVRGPAYDVGAGGVLRPVATEPPATEQPSIEAVPSLPSLPSPPSPYIDDEPASATVDLLATLRERRGRRMRAVVPDEDDAPDAVQEALDSLRDEQENADEDDTRQDAPPLPAPQPVPDRAPVTSVRSRQGKSGRGRKARRSVPDPIRGTHPAGRKLVADDAAPSRSAERDRIVVLPDTDEASRPRPTQQHAPAQAPPRPQPPAQPRPVNPARAQGPHESTGEPGPNAPVDPAVRKGRRAIPSWDDIVFGARRE